MDHEKLAQHAYSYGQATARTLFAIEMEEKKLSEKLRKKLSELKENYERKSAIMKNRAANDLTVCGLQLKENIGYLNQTDDPILAVCEYLKLGKIVLPEMRSLESTLQEVPFIIPMIGHGNLMLAHSSDDTRSLLTEIVWDVISTTAPGQLQVITYNPQLRNQLSFLSNVEQFSTIISMSEFKGLLDNISQEVLHVDSMLKGSADSLVELRKVSKQPVGTLKLVVLQDTDFLSDERLRTQFCQVVGSCSRAGICFVISDIMSAQTQQLFANIQNLHQINVISSNVFSSVKTSHIIEFASERHNYCAEVEAYIKNASNTSVVSIPFSEIEDVNHNWQDSTKDGITFSLGRSGLDVIRLRLGDEKKQLHNMLVTGAAGKGKSNLLEVIIHSVCTRYSPNEIELYLLDFKDGLTFKPYSETMDGSCLPHAKVLGIESERDIGLAVLKHIEHIREERANTYKEAGDCKDITAYRNNNPDARMPRILLIIDEYQKLFEKADHIGLEAAEILENIVRQGRACGIHVILASQTISGAAALLGRTNNIYSQFPIRIALQNSLTESYATFVQGNDGAAKLRVRGEAILNQNYGEISSNQRFTVAYAEPDALKILRKGWYQQLRKDYQPPIVFRKDETFHISSLLESIKSWRRSVVQHQADPMIPCGVAVAVEREQVSIRMTNDAGRNIAIIGSGDDSQSTVVLSNDAIGMIQAIGTSLALQHVDGNVRFSLINGIDKAMFDRNGMTDWLSLMERLGFYVEIIEKDSASEFFYNIAKDVTDPNYRGEEAHYILCLALDRCSTLSLSSHASKDGTSNTFFAPVSEKGIESFQKVLQYGSPQGTHIISWWTNATIYKEHIGYQGDGFVNTKILLRVDNNTAQNILGMFTVWGVQTNRALVHDNTDLESNRIVVPYKPVSKRDCGLVLSEDWNI